MSTSKRALFRIKLGHRSEMLDEPTPDGHTHRWTVFVRSAGPKQFIDRSCVTKVVFTLHPDFPNRRRVIKNPPFEVTETGYAGFLIPVSVSFAGTSKVYKLVYDMNLCLEKYSEHHVEQIVEMKQISATFFDLIINYGGFIKKEKSDKKNVKKENESFPSSPNEEHGLTPENRQKKSKKELKSRENKKRKQVTEERDRNLFKTCDTNSSAHIPVKSLFSDSRKAEKISASNNSSPESKKCYKSAIFNEQPSLKKSKTQSEIATLLDLQRKLMFITDANKLDQIVHILFSCDNLRNEIGISSDNKLTFDLCSLEPSALSKLQIICSQNMKYL